MWRQIEPVEYIVGYRVVNRVMNTVGPIVVGIYFSGIGVAGIGGEAAISPSHQ